MTRQDEHPLVKTYHAKQVAAHAADIAYSDAIVAAGYKDRWTMPADAMRKNPAIAEAYGAKVVADIQAQEWFRRSFEICHPKET